MYNKNSLLRISSLCAASFISSVLSVDMTFHYIGGFNLYQYVDILSSGKTFLFCGVISIISAIIGNKFESLLETTFASITIAASLSIFISFPFALAAHC